MDFFIDNVRKATLETSDIPGNWTLAKYDFTASTTASYVFELRNADLIQSGNDFAIDDISIQDITPASQVPMPASLPLLAAALGGIVALRRRLSV